MRAGSGIEHSEYNSSQTEPVHFIQILMLPRQQDQTPGHVQRSFPPEERDNRWCLVVSPDGRADSLPIDQQAQIHLTRLAAGRTLNTLETDSAPAPATCGNARLNAGTASRRRRRGLRQRNPDAGADSPVEACLFQLQDCRNSPPFLPTLVS